MHPYAELHCISNFSFLRGASHAQELVERAQALGYAALAITDECSLAGVVRAHLAARGTGLALLIGAEFSLRDVFGAAGGQAARLVLLARSREGYGNLSELITRARLRAPKGHYQLLPEDLADGVPGCQALLVPSPLTAFCAPDQSPFESGMTPLLEHPQSGKARERHEEPELLRRALGHDPPHRGEIDIDLARRVGARALGHSLERVARDHAGLARGAARHREDAAGLPHRGLGEIVAHATWPREEPRAELGAIVLGERREEPPAEVLARVRDARPHTLRVLGFTRARSPWRARNVSSHSTIGRSRSRLSASPSSTRRSRSRPSSSRPSHAATEGSGAAPAALAAISSRSLDAISSAYRLPPEAPARITQRLPSASRKSIRHPFASLETLAIDHLAWTAHRSVCRLNIAKIANIANPPPLALLAKLPDRLAGSRRDSRGAAGSTQLRGG